ncbi:MULTISPECIES: adenylate cyclase [Colwellia]|uniref:Putative adenylate cyclase n=1 Tax=Colwellia psychrerythraea (strain 34H / ATCC BAA-681) TaxID=167879 RepID=Q47YV7_COLP3|nr:MULTISPECIES: adenylate cyclase [Colwellia]AAZ25989.1 putative adenylate cyclase [Colwellia psychrerythraea 34H]PKH87018.1 hypothetical protein CXF79_09845 [Colwellia sp. Bg11-28]
MKFFTELKRRNIFKVASVYLLTTWLVLQIIAVISPSLNLPIMFGTIVTVVLIIGFPISCVIAWAFELTPEGMKFTKDVEEDESIRQETGQKLNASLMFIIALLISFIVYDKFFTFQINEKLDLTIAVLPFKDMSPGGTQQYFGDGIAEEILNSLTKISSLKVIARTSSFQFRNEKKDINQIGKQLGAQFILEGSIRKSEDKLRVTAQLIDATTQHHIWSETYDKKLTDVFVLQDQLTFAITQALKLNILKGDLQSSALAKSDNPEAYKLYLKSLPLFHQRTPSGIKDAEKLLEKAIELDHDFLLAKAQLYNLYARYNRYIRALNIEQQKNAELLIRDLLSSPEKFAEKSMAIGMWLSGEGYNVQSIEYFKHSVSEFPSSSELKFIYAYYANIYSHLSRNDIIEMHKSVLSKDPLNTSSRSNLMSLYQKENRLAEMREVIDKGRELQPQHIQSIRDEIFGLIAENNISSAFKIIKKSNDDNLKYYRNSLGSFFNEITFEQALKIGDDYLIAVELAKLVRDKGIQYQEVDFGHMDNLRTKSITLFSKSLLGDIKDVNSYVENEQHFVGFIEGVIPNLNNKLDYSIYAIYLNEKLKNSMDFESYNQTLIEHGYENCNGYPALVEKCFTYNILSGQYTAKEIVALMLKNKGVIILPINIAMLPLIETNYWYSTIANEPEFINLVKSALKN